ncbi:MAG: transcription-repair coupling factor, partial [Defluviitaleaceae bacterium]|nr:transcription-repair coupling factor [Defluviitaleaceae bacterium]
TLTATPIPRTLHMSPAGIRDMSILNEPPQQRQPIQTYVLEHSPEMVKSAIMREMARGGQVYYLHNRVQNIASAAAKVQELVPGAQVAYAHGRMSERELENVMMDFIEGQIDVLVCTTIVESGLDIPNVNTIIIQDADRLGLAQLYQLRGRVGRAGRSSFAYLMYQKDKVLTEVAEKRLQTIREFTEFGAGFKIAMRDLEIRGAGNMLGTSQHGYMDAVGYEMYCKLLDIAVREMRGMELPKDFETLVDLSLDAFIPESYINHEATRLEIYKKISHIANITDFYDVQEEMEDRFGTLPQPGQNLLDIALLKARAHDIDIISIKQKTQNVVITFKNDAKVDPLAIGRVVTESKGKLKFTLGTNPALTYRAAENEVVMGAISSVVAELS